jgi:hypothetical protein
MGRLEKEAGGIRVYGYHAKFYSYIVCSGLHLHMQLSPDFWDGSQCG